jgi:hypothetical protein
MDSRAFTRVTTRHAATITDAHGAQHHGELRDVSLQGVFISGVACPVDTAVAVSIPLAPEVGITAQGRVVRATSEGVGILLELLVDTDSAEHLRRLVLLNTRNGEQTQHVVDELESHVGLKRVPPPA